ncbi:MAG: hypothetical protein QOF06_2393 [Solirubrobacterales bacterium]|jgi:hypothetical protein|nr:hypothetical protein [Solirubrobacterales bacterium]
MTSAVRVYRPKENVVFAAGYLVFLLFLFVGQWGTQMSPVGRSAVIALLGFGALVFFRFGVAGIRASERGVRVINLFSTYELEWREIERFRIGGWKIYPYICLIDLVDGTTRVAFGIQERTNFANGSAQRMADELNEERRARV